MYGRGRELGRARRRFDFSSVSTSCSPKWHFYQVSWYSWSVQLNIFTFCFICCFVLFLFVCFSLGQFRNMLLRCSLAMLRTVQSTRLPSGKWELGEKNSILDFNALQFTHVLRCTSTTVVSHWAWFYSWMWITVVIVGFFLMLLFSYGLRLFIVFVVDVLVVVFLRIEKTDK